MGDAVRVNGQMISWQSVTLKIGVEKYTGFTAVEYGDKRERSLAYGAGKHGAPRGKSAGKYTPDPLVITVWKSTAKAILADLAALATDGKSYGNVSTDIVVSFVEPSDATVIVEALGCTLQEMAASHEEGPEGLNEKLTFQPMRIKRDGKSLYDGTIAGSGA